MKFLLGYKQHMTSVFTEEGRAYAATVISTMPGMVTEIKTKEKHGYSAAQIGAGEVKESKVNKPQIGHAKGKAFRHFKEFRPRPSTKLGAGESEIDVEAGVTINVSVFAPGDTVEVSAISKGKGFQGVVKRHGFHGGSRTHGQKHSEREPGSIGGGGRAGGRVAKGMRMAGRMGGERVTVRNLKVLQVIPETNELVLSGAVPGRRGTLVEIRG